MSLKELKTSFNNGEITKQDYINRIQGIHCVLFDYAEFIKDTDIGMIEVTDGSVVMTTRAKKIKLMCDKDDKRIIPIEILNFDSYEDDVLQMMEALIEGQSTIFDIGGNIGWYAINLAKAKPDATVLTFEPIPKTFAYLQKNLTMNEVSNVYPFNFGFSDQEQELTFYYYPEVSGNASLTNVSDRDDVEKIRCQVRRLDEFVRQSNQAPDFIKCDVEGAEFFVFKGGIDVIERHKPIIFAELLRKWSAKFAYHPNEVINLLKGMGYRCFAVAGEKLAEFIAMDDQTMETNFFFLHADKHGRLIDSKVKA